MWVYLASVTAEDEARSLVDVILGRMGIGLAAALAFVRLDDGVWAAQADSAGFEWAGDDALTVISRLVSDLGPVTWVSQSAKPPDPDSVPLGQMDWPPGYFALGGRKEAIIDPAVRAVQVQVRRVPPPWKPTGSESDGAEKAGSNETC
jgi:hypothetical protein